MELSDFATARRPLRCSSLPLFMACPWAVIMKFLEIHKRDGGSAAQTGSATHKAIQAFHTNGKEVEAAIKAMKAVGAEYPMADFADAERLFRLYAADPQNRGAQVVHTEILVQGTIAKGVYLEGHLDQIREAYDGEWSVWDLKTSRLSGLTVRDNHTYQIAAYAVLASKRFKRDVIPGGVIMVRGYEGKAQSVFYSYNLTLDHAKTLMEAVADRVRAVRNAQLHAVPGEHCAYCIGTNRCLTLLGEYQNG